MVANYLTSTGFMLVVLLILFFKISKDMKQEKVKRMYQILDITVALYVLLDAGFAVGFMTGQTKSPSFQAIIFLFFIVYVTTPFVWQLFVHSYVNVPHHRWYRILEKVPLVVLLSMILFSLPTGYVWQITDTGEYIRGAGFQLFTAINLFYYLEAFGNGLYIVYRKMHKKEAYLLQSLFLSSLPLAAILINTYLIPLQMTYPFQPFCLVLGTLFAYLFMADRQNKQLEDTYRENLQQALEMEKEASRRAIEADKVKSIFLANMSHDIRTPINAILGFADIIAQHPEDTDSVTNAVTKIRHSGIVLSNLINDVLDLTRIESNKMQLDLKPADLENVLQELAELFGPDMQRNELNFKISRSLQHPYVLCDVGKLQRILINIINNSVKFTPEGGQITLSVTEYSSETEKDIYEFLLQDTGIGISQEFQAHIFEAFEQEHSAALNGGSGAGLGLSIVKRLVDLMSGTITIDSEPQKGTSITIRIPFSRTAEKDICASQHSVSAGFDLSGINILLVEDNPLNKELAQTMLEQKHAVITWAANGKEAVDCFSQSPANTYDIILMDVMMPVMDGLEATRKIRSMARSDANRIPIFALTANAFREDIQKSKEAGVNEHLSKPLDYDLLIRLIAQYTSHH